MGEQASEHLIEPGNREALLLLGTGAVSLALAKHLEQSGSFPGGIRVWGRSKDSLRIFQSLGVETFLDLTEGVIGVGTAVLCVSDSALEEVAYGLGEALKAESDSSDGCSRGPVVVLHTSGFRGVDALDALHSTGAELGGMHPMAALAGSAMVEPGGGAPFIGVTFGVSGSPVARQRAREIAELLGGQIVLVRDELRELYHGAAALLSGGLVALFSEAEACLAESLDKESDEQSPSSQDEARRILRSLLASTTSNLLELPPDQALTGPVSRGDSAVVDGHARAFAGLPSPRTKNLYELLTTIMRELTAKRDRRDP